MSSNTANNRFAEIRQDCLLASAAQTDVRSKLGFARIAVTGGTGFLGSWIAETVAALNDEYRLGITLDLYARNIRDWAQQYPHLAGRADIQLMSQDVRSPFEFPRNTNFVVHAAGIPNNRVHASDPLRVQQTTVQGLNNALEAASQLDNLTRFLNVSSCLVNGRPNRPGALSENEYFAIPCDQLHTVYVEAKRAAENLAAIYRSQFRLPVSTIRPFTFAGAYQELDRPWAINNFMREVLTGSEIRIHGDGLARRSYLHGADAAWWTLAALAKGQDGAVYNVGSATPITHLDLVKLIGEKASPKPRVLLNTLPSKQLLQDDLFPDITLIRKTLGVTQTCSLDDTIDKAWRWYKRS
ncbi:NAD-dependent epimerase/dehydratase family protein [Roseateles oligotrophus]|uniref:NAD(P)-dependent oxidoreductase n=1 Tax=Roseateles oligotrophus TaxID=1769250 RepID=A0ABT2YM97_9BURK|nr:NAD(P)-dependent oxidoreductase [Roseateles oligotrophus]MCV2371194.1 NAD(P)-dependent oxidoreductase [Roseateles oligotrophus]